MCQEESERARERARERESERESERARERASERASERERERARESERERERARESERERERARESEREEDAGIGTDRAQRGKASITTVGPVTSAGMLMYPNSYLPWLMTASLPTLSPLFLLYPAVAPVTQSCARRCCSTANTTSTLRKGTDGDLCTIALRQRKTVQCLKTILVGNLIK